MPQTQVATIFKPRLDPLRPLPARLTGWLESALSRASSLARLDGIYQRVHGTSGQVAFLDRVLAELGVSHQASPQELARIPSQGPLMVVANHPYGALEGIVLARLLLGLRPDVKIMANYLLERIPELNDLFIFVDPFDAARSLENNLRPLREAIRWLEGGGLLAVFPAGEVAHATWSDRRVQDPAWSPMAAGIARRTRAEVLPIFFAGHNGPLFQAAGMIHPRLRTALLARELVNKKGCCLGLKIGHPITYKRLAARRNAQEATAYLRRRTYLLGQAPAAQEPPPAQDAGALRALPNHVRAAAAEVRALPPEQALLTSGDFTVLYARRQQIPHLMDEIGRVREICFRRVGEGTGLQRDIDRFDDYYLHLFLWNQAEEELAGGYRLGQVDRILQERGSSGLYTSTLFLYQPQFLRRVNPSLELGRSFVDPKYQRSYSGLMLLWKGIGRFIALHPRYRYLFGPVSLSNAYSPLSRRLIQRFLDDYFASPLSQLVQPRRPPRYQRRPALDCKELLHGVTDIEELSEVVSDLESSGWGVPILFKQYLKLAARAVAWNLDPDFGQALDCLMVVDLMETDAKIVRRYIGNEEADAYRRLHLGAATPEELPRCA
ncbi:MAG: lysophospholipid acyltransferase family protein [Desulfarculus sp.]|nr:MAG: lysophospholipid acyltransferase family protein [Desulfarculus sp.]